MTPTAVRAMVGMINAAHSREADEQSVEDTIMVWVDLLSDVDDAAGLAACKQALRDSSFPPKPADIVRLAGARTPSVEARAELAWEDALEWTKAGAYRSPAFDDPLTSRVIREMGGWPEFCRSEQPTHWLRREFVAIYGNHAEATAGKEVAAIPTAGIFERPQVERGGDLEPVRALPPLDRDYDDGR